MFELTDWSNSAIRSTEERDTGRPRLRRTAAVGVLALGVALWGALAPVGLPAEAAKPQCVEAPCPPPPNERAPQSAAAARPKCLAVPCPPPDGQ